MRQRFDQFFAGAIKSPEPGEFVVLDANTGKLIKRWPFPGGGAIRAIDEHLVYVIQNGAHIAAVDPTTGQTKPFIAKALNATGLTTDATGNIYASLDAGAMQVVVFDSKGKEIRRIGRDGGRQEIGAWQPDGMLYPAGVAVDKDGKLWVMERDRYPKRVSVWSLADGKLVKDFFGPPHYGNSGAAINPRDPNLMVSVGCEWRLDPKTGKSVCLGTFDREYSDFAAFREGKNGKLYLFAQSGKYGMGSLKIFERVGDAHYVKLAELYTHGTEPEFRSGRGTTTMWTDSGLLKDRNETQARPGALRVTGSNGWSLNLGPDMTLYVFDNVDQKLKAMPIDGFTKTGAPKYDLTKLKDLPPAISDGYEPGMSCAAQRRQHKNPHQPPQEKSSGLYLWTCFDLASGKELWTYPNPYFQVHGSHNAPAADPGLFRGAYGAVGTANAPGVGDMWIINGNLGEWGVLSSDGFYVTRLFNGNVFDWKWPAAATPGADMTNLPPGSGGEDFGGSATQGDDGKIYIQAGKCATWNLELTGIEKTVVIPGSQITLTDEDAKTAIGFRERALQVSPAPASLRSSACPFISPARLPTTLRDAKSSRTKRPKNRPFAPPWHTMTRRFMSAGK